MRSTKNEKWKPVKGYEGLYEISDYGNVKSLAKRVDSGKCHRSYPERILKAYPDPKGYVKVVLSDWNHKSHTCKVHRLVADAFLDNPYKLPQVNHIDGDKKNNTLHNLEWCDQSTNMKHAFSNGLKSVSCELNPSSKLSKEDVLFIRSHYKPRDTEYGVTALSIKFGVHRQTIGRIVRGVSWKEGDQIGKTI